VHLSASPRCAFAAERHGRIAGLFDWALKIRFRRRRPRRVDLTGLSDHLLRDIGLMDLRLKFDADMQVWRP
jgi:uncharacterized protein YjiS (DUF1127 family)